MNLWFLTAINLKINVYKMDALKVLARMAMHNNARIR